MSLVTNTKGSSVTVYQAPTYEQATSSRDNAVWQRLDGITVGEALEMWLETIPNKLTAKNYRSGLRQLVERGFLHTDLSLQSFSLINSNATVDRIKIETKEWSESSKQARAGCFISFTQYLNRKYDGLIRRASPCKEGNMQTFKKIREKVKTKAMSREQADAFSKALAKINQRDCLIAKILLQGGKRVSEGLSITTDCIDWSKCQITFTQAKTKGINKATIITYPGTVIEELRAYIGETRGLVFRTSTGKGVCAGQLAKTFEKAGIKAGIPFKITPHVLRATAVTLYKEAGSTDSDLTGVTGHANIAMMQAYNKADLSNNASKKVNLVQ